MNAKKLLALLMSLVLLLGALSIPALAADEETASPEATGTPTEGVTDSASDDANAAVSEMQAKYAQIEAQLDAASKKYDGSAVVATVNGREVTWKLYYYLLGSLTSQFINYTMAIPDFSTDVGDGTTLQDALRETLEARMKYYTVPLIEAEARGLTETVNAEVETQWQNVVEQYGGVDALMEAIESAYLDEPTYRTLLSSNAAFNAIMENTYGLNGEKLSDEDVLAWANDDDYLRCKHILFLTENEVTRRRQKEKMRRAGQSPAPTLHLPKASTFLTATAPQIPRRGAASPPAPPTAPRASPPRPAGRQARPRAAAGRGARGRHPRARRLRALRYRGVELWLPHHPPSAARSRGKDSLAGFRHGRLYDAARRRRQRAFQRHAPRLDRHRRGRVAGRVRLDGV